MENVEFQTRLNNIYQHDGAPTYNKSNRFFDTFNDALEIKSRVINWLNAHRFLIVKNTTVYAVSSTTLKELKKKITTAVNKITQQQIVCVQQNVLKC